LADRYINEVEYFLHRGKHGYLALVPSANESLIDEHHFGIGILEEAMPSLLKKYAPKKESRIRIPKYVVRKLDLHKNYTEVIVQDILNENFYSTKFGAGYVTRRPVDLDVVNALASDSERQTNLLLAKHLAHEVPVIQGIKIKEILKLRENEGEAFLVYRNALKKAIADAKAEPGAKMRDIFQDVVRPQLEKIDATLKTARATLAAGMVQDAALASGVVGVGLFSGLLPMNIGAILSAIGGYHFADSLLSKARELAMDPSAIRENQFYFLWRVKQRSATRDAT